MTATDVAQWFELMAILAGLIVGLGVAVHQAAGYVDRLSWRLKVCRYRETIRVWEAGQRDRDSERAWTDHLAECRRIRRLLSDNPEGTRRLLAEVDEQATADLAVSA